MAGFTNDIMNAENVNFTGVDPTIGSVTTNGQLLIGSTAAPNIKVGALTSPAGTITIGYSSPNITLDLAGGGEAIDSIAVQTGTSPIVPTAAGLVTINGATVAAGTNPVRTDGTGANTMAVEVQISQALAATDATKIGLSNFDSAAFDVDANGFVQLNGGGIAATSFDVQANTAPGTDPVVPTAAGVVTVNGAAVANHSVVLETRSRAANAYNLEVQYSAAVAATDATKSGVAHFDSSRFTVDANGFVSANGSGIGETITGQSGGALNPTAGNWNIFGGSVAAGTSPLVSSGAGSTLTLNVQRSQALAAADSTKVGVSNFFSGQFSVDSNGFVTIISGGMPWTDVTTATQALSVQNGYVTDRGAGVTYTLPATATLGDIIKIDGKLGLTTIAQNANQAIRMGSSISTTGVGGSVVGTNVGDCITLRCTTGGASTIWIAENWVGNWTVT